MRSFLESFTGHRRTRSEITLEALEFAARFKNVCFATLDDHNGSIVKEDGLFAAALIRQGPKETTAAFHVANARKFVGRVAKGVCGSQEEKTFIRTHRCDLLANHKDKPKQPFCRSLFWTV